MQPFLSHTGLAAAMLQANLNTDLIIPKQFLKTIHRQGLGRNLFHDLRYREDGSEDPGFALNREPGRRASILLAGANFGCVSSREHAPWALLDFGIRVVLAPSFADIFANNAVRNGLLPGILPEATLAVLAAHAAQGLELELDLRSEQVRAGGSCFPFRTDPWARTTLLEGLDEIARTLRSMARVEAFERGRRAAEPWL